MHPSSRLRKGLGLPLVAALCLQLLGSGLAAPVAHAAVDPSCPTQAASPTLPAPVQQHPAKDTFTVGAYTIFSWDAVPGASKYVLQVFSSDPGKANPTSYLCETTDNLPDGNDIIGVRVDGMPDGSYWWEVRALNPATSEDGAWSTITHFTQDTAAPTVSLTEPTTHEALDGTVQVKGAVSDANPFHYRLSITGPAGGVYDSGSIAQAGGSHAVTYPWDTSALPDGLYAVHLRAQDGAGNVSSQVAHVFVDHTALAAPTVTSPAANAYQQAGSFDLAWNPVANATTYSVVLSASSSVDADGSLTAPLAGYPATTMLTDRAVSGLAEGTYYYQVRATDFRGKNGPWSSLGTIHIDATAPATPSVVVPKDGSYAQTRTLTIVGSAYSDASPQASAYWQVATDPSFTHVVFERLSASELTSVAIPSGEALMDNAAYYARVSYEDAAGNASAWSAATAFTVDATAPAAPVVTSPTSPVTTTASSYVITGTAEANSLVTVKQGSATVASQQLSGGATAFSVTVPLASGQAATLAVTATDAAGNVSAATTVATITQSATATAVSNPSGPVAIGGGTAGSAAPATTVAVSTPAPVRQVATAGGSSAASRSSRDNADVTASNSTPTPSASASPSPTPTENGDVKAASTSRNWTPWIILAILIGLAILATAGYFYWFGGEEEGAPADTAETAPAEDKKPEPADSSKKNGDKKADKEKRW